jgi:NAD(P)-dependent dehydrogenase (short-subunit alcohol dehydrogenase family)
MQTKHFDLQQSVNLRGAFLVTREALPHLREAKGYVVNLASIAGTLPTPGLASYGAAKAALIALTRSLDREETDNGVRATALCPAFVDTPMAAWTGLAGEEMIQPEDCAEMVRALLRLSHAARVPVVVIERAGERI